MVVGKLGLVEVISGLPGKETVPQHLSYFSFKFQHLRAGVSSEAECLLVMLQALHSVPRTGSGAQVYVSV